MKEGFFRNMLIATVSLVASSTAFAAMDMDSRVTQLESQMQQVRTETAMGTYGAKTASARPEVDGKGWFITFDAIYWHPKVGGTEYAYSDQDPVGAMPVKGRTKHVDFSWDWGLRAGLGYNFEHDGWDAHLDFTYFDSNASDSTSAGLNSSIIPLRGSAQLTNISTPNQASGLFTFCQSAKTQFDFDYLSLDLELGRAYFVSSKLSFRPHVGLKTAWINEEQIIRYTGKSDADGELGLGITTVHLKDDCDFWGLGPRAGLESKWHLGYGFSIFGNVAAALLFGNYDVDHKERWTANQDSRINLSANRHAFSPTAQFQLGLRYDKYIHDNRQHIGVGIGYEAQYWWRQNQMLKIDDDAVLKFERFSEDLSMHGLTIDLRFDF